MKLSNLQKWGTTFFLHSPGLSCSRDHVTSSSSSFLWIRLCKAQTDVGQPAWFFRSPRDLVTVFELKASLPVSLFIWKDAETQEASWSKESPKWVMWASERKWTRGTNQAGCSSTSLLGQIFTVTDEELAASIEELQTDSNAYYGDLEVLLFVGQPTAVAFYFVWIQYLFQDPYRTWWAALYQLVSLVHRLSHEGLGWSSLGPYRQRWQPSCCLEKPLYPLRSWINLSKDFSPTS